MTKRLERSLQWWQRLLNSISRSVTPRTKSRHTSKIWRKSRMLLSKKKSTQRFLILEIKFPKTKIKSRPEMLRLRLCRLPSTRSNLQEPRQMRSSSEPKQKWKKNKQLSIKLMKTRSNSKEKSKKLNNNLKSSKSSLTMENLRKIPRIGWRLQKWFNSWQLIKRKSMKNLMKQKKHLSKLKLINRRRRKWERLLKLLRLRKTNSGIPKKDRRLLEIYSRQRLRDMRNLRPLLMQQLVLLNKLKQLLKKKLL